MFDYRKENNIPIWVLVLVAILAAIAATQYWGFYPASDPALTELTVIGLMIREGDFYHPLKPYFRMLPAYVLLDPNLLTSAQFNFWVGILTKLCQLTLSFFLLKQLTKNQFIIIFLIVFLTLGLYVELHPLQFSVKYPTYYGFRYVANTFVLLSLLLMFRKKIAWASISLGCAFVFHPKVGALSLILLSTTFVLYQYSVTRSLKLIAVLTIKILFPAAMIILVTSQFAYWGHYFDGVSHNFPTYLAAIKVEPDDYFFFDNYANLTPEIFQQFSPGKFIFLVMFLTALSLIIFWKVRRPERIITEVELMLVAIMYFLLLYFARMSMELMIFLGLINSVCYVRYVGYDRRHESGNVLFGNLAGIVFIVVTTLFIIGVLAEHLIPFLPGAVGPLIYAFKIWKAPHLNTLIGTLFLGILLVRLIDIKINQITRARWTRRKLELMAIMGLTLCVIGSGFFHDTRMSSNGLLSGWDIYRPVFGNQAFVIDRSGRKALTNKTFAYEEKRVSRVESSDFFHDYLIQLRKINHHILEKQLLVAESKLKSIDDTESPFLLMSKQNAQANWLAARGKLREAHKIYRLATNNSIVIQKRISIWVRPTGLRA